MTDKEKFEQTKKDFNTALLLINNIVESGSEKVNRFKFTPKETTALLFVVDLLSSHIKELES